MAAIVFDNPGTEQSSEFLKMCKDNADGWYLNKRAGDSPMLHRANCRHKRKEDGDFANNPKIFHQFSKREVLDRAKSEYEIRESDIIECKHCCKDF